MEKPILSKGINPYALSPTERNNLAQELYEVHCQIFTGVDFAAFKSYVLAPHAHRTRIYKCTNSAQNLVGYMAVHDVILNLKGNKIRILKTEIGLLRAYRGHNIGLKVMFREGLRAWFQNRCHNLWFMATPVHPNPYCATARQMKTMYPRPGEALPAKIEALMEQLTKQLQLEVPNPAFPLQRRVGWQVRNSPQERAALSMSDDPMVQFYLAQNPTYAEGNGLMMLVPCYIPNALSSLKNLIRKPLKRLSRKVQGDRLSQKVHLSSLSCNDCKVSPSAPPSLASTNAILSSTLP